MQTIYEDEVVLKNGPESQRNGSNIMWNPCHEEVRLFWEQREVLPSINIVSLVKCLVSVCVYTRYIVYIHYTLLAMYCILCLNIKWH